MIHRVRVSIVDSTVAFVGSESVVVFASFNFERYERLGDIAVYVLIVCIVILMGYAAYFVFVR